MHSVVQNGFSTLNLASGYWKVLIHLGDIEKTAFTTPFGLYHFKVMPFGLANAPTTIERMVELVFYGLHWEICPTYVYDVIVFERTFKEHMVRLHQILTRIKEANLKLLPGNGKLKWPESRSPKDQDNHRMAHTTQC